jgi:hypothetical protein
MKSIFGTASAHEWKTARCHGKKTQARETWEFPVRAERKSGEGLTLSEKEENRK